MTAMTTGELARAFFESLPDTAKPMAWTPSAWAEAFQKLLDDLVIFPVDKDEKHVIRFDADGWVIQHPLIDRLTGTLFDCELNEVAHEQFRPGTHKHRGRWTCELDVGEGRVRLLEKLPWN